MIRLVFVFALLMASPALADEKSGTAPDHLVIQMAQHLLKGEFGLDRNAQFEPAGLHPQKHPRYWAVVGRLSFKNPRNKWEQRSYVVAVLQTCDAYEDVKKCWVLQKAAIDGRIVIDRGNPGDN